MDPRDATHLKMITPQLSTFCIFEDSPFTSLLQILVWARQLQFSAFSLFSSVPYNGIKLVVHGLCCWSHIYSFPASFRPVHRYVHVQCVQK